MSLKKIKRLCVYCWSHDQILSLFLYHFNDDSLLANFVIYTLLNMQDHTFLWPPPPNNHKLWPFSHCFVDFGHLYASVHVHDSMISYIYAKNDAIATVLVTNQTPRANPLILMYLTCHFAGGNQVALYKALTKVSALKELYTGHSFSSLMSHACLIKSSLCICCHNFSLQKGTLYFCIWSLFSISWEFIFILF